MKANYSDYIKLWNGLYMGVPLTDEKQSDNALTIFNYLKDGGAGKLMTRIGVGLSTKYINEVPVEHRLFYIAGENKGRTLTISEIENIGLLLLMYWKEIECQEK